MADEATERFLQNAPGIIVFFITFFCVYSLSFETVEINGRNIPVSFIDYPEVFVCAFTFFGIAHLTGSLSEIFFEGKFLRWCCIVLFTLGLCLLFICRLLSSATLIGSDSGWTYEEL